MRPVFLVLALALHQSVMAQISPYQYCTPIESVSPPDGSAVNYTAANFTVTVRFVTDTSILLGSSRIVPLAAVTTAEWHAICTPVWSPVHLTLAQGFPLMAPIALGCGSPCTGRKLIAVFAVARPSANNYHVLVLNRRLSATATGENYSDYSPAVYGVTPLCAATALPVCDGPAALARKAAAAITTALPMTTQPSDNSNILPVEAGLLQHSRVGNTSTLSIAFNVTAAPGVHTVALNFSTVEIDGTIYRLHTPAGTPADELPLDVVVNVPRFTVAVAPTEVMSVYAVQEDEIPLIFQENFAPTGFNNTATPVARSIMEGLWKQAQNGTLVSRLALVQYAGPRNTRPLLEYTVLEMQALFVECTWLMSTTLLPRVTIGAYNWFAGTGIWTMPPADLSLVCPVTCSRRTTVCPHCSITMFYWRQNSSTLVTVHTLDRTRISVLPPQVVVRGAEELGVNVTVHAVSAPLQAADVVGVLTGLHVAWTHAGNQWTWLSSALVGTACGQVGTSLQQYSNQATPCNATPGYCTPPALEQMQAQTARSAVVALPSGAAVVGTLDPIAGTITSAIVRPAPGSNTTAAATVTMSATVAVQVLAWREPRLQMLENGDECVWMPNVQQSTTRGDTVTGQVRATLNNAGDETARWRAAVTCTGATPVGANTTAEAMLWAGSSVTVSMPVAKLVGSEGVSSICNLLAWAATQPLWSATARRIVMCTVNLTAFGVAIDPEPSPGPEPSPAPKPRPGLHLSSTALIAMSCAAATMAIICALLCFLTRNLKFADVKAFTVMLGARIKLNVSNI